MKIPSYKNLLSESLEKDGLNNRFILDKILQCNTVAECNRITNSYQELHSSIINVSRFYTKTFFKKSIYFDWLILNIHTITPIEAKTINELAGELDNSSHSLSTFDLILSKPFKRVRHLVKEEERIQQANQKTEKKQFLKKKGRFKISKANRRKHPNNIRKEDHDTWLTKKSVHKTIYVGRMYS